MFSNVLVGEDGGPGGRDAIALATLMAAPDAAITPAHVDGPVGRGLHEIAERDGVDLLVVGSSRRGLIGRVFLGDDAADSLNGAPCAVAIAPSEYADIDRRLATLGVGYDASPESEQALGAARELAARSGSTIKALAVVSLQSIPYGEPVPDNWPDVAKDLMGEERRRLRGLDDIEGDVTYGEPSEELWRFSFGVDLLIIGSRSHGPLGRLLNGSCANYLARRAPCPLLVLPRSALRRDERSGSTTKGILERQRAGA